jgi:hypothetical protein
MLTGAGVLIAIHLWAAAVGATGAGLEIQAGSPEDPCPDLPATKAAVAGHLGGVLVPAGQKSWVVRYTTYYAPELTGDRVLRLEIVDPAGQRQQVKDLPTAGASCEGLAEAIALVVEQHFRPPETAVAAAPAPRPPRLGVAAGLAARAVEAPGLALGARVALGERLALRLDTVVPRWHREQAIARGTATVDGWPITLGLPWGLIGDGRWTLELGPEGSLSIESGQTEGLTQTGQSTRVVVGLGGRLEAAVRVWGDLSLTLAGALEGTLPLAGSRFEIEQDGGRTEVLAPPRVVGLLVAGVRFSFFR